MLDKYVAAGDARAIVTSAETGRPLRPFEPPSEGWGFRLRRPQHAIALSTLDAAATTRRWEALVEEQRRLIAVEPGIIDTYLQEQPAYIKSISACDPELYRLALKGDWWRLLRACGEWLDRSPRDAIAAWLACEAYRRIGRLTASVKRAKTLLADETTLIDPGPQYLFLEPAFYFASRCLLVDPRNANAWALFADSLGTLYASEEVSDSEALRARAACRAMALSSGNRFAQQALEDATGAYAASCADEHGASRPEVKAPLDLQWHATTILETSSGVTPTAGSLGIRWRNQVVVGAYLIECRLTNLGDRELKARHFRQQFTLWTAGDSRIVDLQVHCDGDGPPYCTEKQVDEQQSALMIENLSPGASISFHFMLIGLSNAASEGQDCLDPEQDVHFDAVLKDECDPQVFVPLSQHLDYEHL